MRLVQEGKESTRKARLPGVARRTKEADSKGGASGDIPKSK
jgi:hypothetical protein